jgi:pimeloyl-ACP methyl ester carboxylesterase
MTETAVQLGAAKSLVGILTRPDAGPTPAPAPAVILLNAGFTHRVGPNRLYVQLARNIAARGWCVLRFDFSGIGDSDSRTDNLPFAVSTILETKQAMDYLGAAQDVHAFVLAGICSGADVAVRTACRDPRVVGAVAINGTFMDAVQSDVLREHIENCVRRRYYRKHPFHLRTLVGFLAHQARSLPQRRALPTRPVDLSSDCRLLLERGVHLLLIYSEGSAARDAFHLTLEAGLKSWRTSAQLRIRHVAEVDHIFTPLWSQRLLVNLVEQWLYDLWGADDE